VTENTSAVSETEAPTSDALLHVFLVAEPPAEATAGTVPADPAPQSQE
jgi:hypothetical protein